MPVQQYWHVYHSYTADLLHSFYGRRQQQLVIEYTRIQSYNNNSMTSANGGIYAGRYPCDGWVDNLEPTVKALVRWATGKRLTNRLPKLSLITLPPLNNGILGLRMGPYVPSPKFFTFSGDPGRVIYQILDMRKFTFLRTSFSWWT